MTSNLIPTEAEIEDKAKQLFPENKSLQASFILGVWNTIYNMKTNKKK